MDDKNNLPHFATLIHNQCEAGLLLIKIFRETKARFVETSDKENETDNSYYLYYGEDHKGNIGLFWSEKPHGIPKQQSFFDKLLARKFDTNVWINIGGSQFRILTNEKFFEALKLIDSEVAK